MQLGEKQLLKVVKKVEFGVYLAWKYFYIRIPRTV